MPEIIINGPAGRIEGRYHRNPDPKCPVVLILHPHPLHGGTMNNKVVYSLYKTFVDNGFSVLRINFRGVGRSEGKFDHGVGELLDATAVMNWLHDQNMSSTEFWIAGFSFGAWIALQTVMRRPEIENYVLVAPPASNSKFDFNFIVPCTSTGFVVQGDKDEIAKEQDVARLAEKLKERDEAEIFYQVITGGDHFFTGKLNEFEAAVDSHIKDRLAVDANRVRKIKRDRRRRRKNGNIEKRPERNYFPVKALSSFENL